jgi:AcrR family transcriptional regulator
MRRPGRRRDEARGQEILRAALEGVAALGYDRLTLDDVAARAHAGKATLYRRWPSKAALITDAVMAFHVELTAPDTGSLRGDLDAILATLQRGADDDARLVMAVCAGLSTAASRDPELAVAFWDHIVGPRRRLLLDVLERGRGRGEVAPDRDLELVADTVLALNLFRFVTRGEVPGPESARRIFDEVVYPLAIATTA